MKENRRFYIPIMGVNTPGNAYHEYLQRYGLRMSVGRVRTFADSASAESVFAQLKARVGASLPISHAAGSD